MKSNGLLKWLMIPLALLVVFIGIKLFPGGHASTAERHATDIQLTPQETKALGIEGDTPRDTVATLVGEVKQLRNELQTSLGDNKNQKTENDRLRQRESDIDQRIQGALASEHERLQQDREQAANDKQQAQSLLQELEHRLDKGSHPDLPVGLGLADGDAQGVGADINWVEPQDIKPSRDKNHSSAGSQSSSNADGPFPSSFGPESDHAQKTLDVPVDAATESGPRSAGARPKPIYTVPTNATLMGSVAMTALIGRVPIDGTVNDPYPFKVLIGADNLTANGIDIPDVAGAVVSGTASGDWTLSCVRGQIRSVTFVFHDGTIRTIPQDGGNSATNSAQSNGNSMTLGGLGWISDPYGIPCVSGVRRSNVAQYLGTQALITAAGAGAASFIKNQNDSVSYISNGNGSLGTVGITGNEAMGRILAGGVQDMSQWVNKLYGQAFAAVYVKPGAQVAVHLERPLDIDYDPKARKVNYHVEGTHVPELD